jgi:hypothetical protein
VQNREISRSEWGSFLRGFSQAHEDWLVTVRIVSPDLGSEVQARDLPLEGIVADPKGTGPISIHLGRDPKGNLEHEVPHPTHVWVRLSDEGAEEGIEIESRDGIRTVAEFRSAPPAEAVDGILHP